MPRGDSTPTDVEFAKAREERGDGSEGVRTRVSLGEFQLFEVSPFL